MKTAAIVAILFLILADRSNAEEPEFSGALRIKEDRYIFTLENRASSDWIIRDLRFGIESATLGMGDILVRGREWTLLLRSGSVFPTYLITIEGTGKIDPATYADGNLYLQLMVAKFDRAERKMGKWQPVRVAFRVVEDKSEEAEADE